MVLRIGNTVVNTSAIETVVNIRDNDANTSNDSEKIVIGNNQISIGNTVQDIQISVGIE